MYSLSQYLLIDYLAILKKWTVNKFVAFGGRFFHSWAVEGQITTTTTQVHFRSAFEPGASGLPYYYTPPVCVPAVIGGLAVWRHNNKKQIGSYELCTCHHVRFVFKTKKLHCYVSPQSVCSYVN